MDSSLLQQAQLVLNAIDEWSRLIDTQQAITPQKEKDLKSQIQSLTQTPAFSLFFSNIFFPNLQQTEQEIASREPNPQNLTILRQAITAFIFQGDFPFEQTGLPAREILEQAAGQLGQVDPQNTIDVRQIVRQTIGQHNKSLLEKAGNVAQLQQSLQKNSQAALAAILAQEPADQRYRTSQLIRQQRSISAYGQIASQTAFETYTHSLVDTYSSELERQKTIQNKRVQKGEIDQAGADRQAQEIAVEHIQQLAPSLQTQAAQTAVKKISKYSETDIALRGTVAVTIQSTPDAPPVTEILDRKTYLQRTIELALNASRVHQAPAQIITQKQELDRLENARLFQSYVAPQRDELVTRLRAFYTDQIYSLVPLENQTKALESLTGLINQQINLMEQGLGEELTTLDTLPAAKISQALEQTTEKTLQKIVRDAGLNLDYPSPDPSQPLPDKTRSYSEVEQAATQLTQEAEGDVYAFFNLNFRAGKIEDIPQLTTLQALNALPKRNLPQVALNAITQPGPLTEIQILHLSNALGTDFTALQFYLNGHTSQTLTNLAKSLEGGFSVGDLALIKKINPNDPRLLKIKELSEQLEKLEELIKSGDIKLKGLNKLLFSVFKARATINNAKYKIYDRVFRLNPFRPLAFGKDFIDQAIFDKKKFIEKQIKDHKVLSFLYPRFKTKEAWKNFLKKHEKLAKVVKFLPVLTPSGLWDLGKRKAFSWLRKKAVDKAAAYLIKKGFDKAAQELVKNGFKALLKFAIKEGLGSVVGGALGAIIPIPVIGPVLGAIAGWLIEKAAILLIKYNPVTLLAKKGWESLSPGTQKAITIGGIGLLLATPLFSLLFASLPALLIAGGALGLAFSLYKGFSSIGTFVSNAAAGLGKGVSSFLQGISHAGVQVGATLANAAPIALAVTGTGTMITLASFYSAWVYPWGEPRGTKPFESRYVKVEKKASKSQFSNIEVAVPRTITYTVTITPKQDPLTSVQIEDEISVESLSGAPPIPELTLTNPQTLPTIIDKETVLTYQISNIDNRYKDTRIRNAFRLTALVGKTTETVTATEKVEIGNPPRPTTVQMAIDVVNILLNCPGLEQSKTNGVIVNKSSWSAAKGCLKANGIEQNVLDEFETSIERFENNLQCVGFVLGISQGSLFPPNGHAKAYCSEPNLQTDWSKLSEGDYIVSGKGQFGHVAIVIGVDGIIVRVAEAMGDTGIVQFRNLTKETLEQYYCGFLKIN